MREEWLKAMSMLVSSVLLLAATSGCGGGGGGGGGDNEPKESVSISSATFNGARLASGGHVNSCVGERATVQLFFSPHAILANNINVSDNCPSYAAPHTGTFQLHDSDQTGYTLAKYPGLPNETCSTSVTVTAADGTTDTVRFTETKSECAPLIYFSEDFNYDGVSASLSPDSQGTWTHANGSLYRPSYTSNSDRHYVSTVTTDYVDRDFVAGVSFSLTSPPEGGGAVLFFGIGSGDPDPSAYNEVTHSVLFRIHTMEMSGGNGGRVDAVAMPGLLDFQGGGVDFYRIHTEGGIHRVEFAKQGNTMHFAIDENYNGTFTPDAIYTLNNLSSWAPWLTDVNSRIFFGTHSSHDVFDSFRVGPFN